MAAADVERESEGREGRLAVSMMAVSGAVLESPCTAGQAMSCSRNSGLPCPRRPVALRYLRNSHLPFKRAGDSARFFRVGASIGSVRDSNGLATLRSAFFRDR
jgi:hypothetical protein